MGAWGELQVAVTPKGHLDLRPGANPHWSREDHDRWNAYDNDQARRELADAGMVDPTTGTCYPVAWSPLSLEACPNTGQTA